MHSQSCDEQVSMVAGAELAAIDADNEYALPASDAPVRHDRVIAGQQSVFARIASIAASSAPATMCNCS